MWFLTKFSHKKLHIKSNLEHILESHEVNHIKGEIVTCGGQKIMEFIDIYKNCTIKSICCLFQIWNNNQMVCLEIRGENLV